MYYLSSRNEDGSDPEYEKLGWKKLEEYDPSQRLWKSLANLIEGGALSDDMADDPEEMTLSDYYATLPFAALFFACKVSDFTSDLNDFFIEATVITSPCFMLGQRFES
jgi:proteasome assembly chaperone 2